jgi:predicted dinucleotide-binding enzyme
MKSIKGNMTKIGILGTGVVGSAIGSKLVQLGYEVKMGSRANHNQKAVEWAKKNGINASEGSFEDAAKFGEIVFLCVKGEGASDALKMAKEENLNVKTVVDISNPLDFSRGMPPTLLISNTDSLGERNQKAFPKANFVKTLNIVNCEIMVDPTKSGGNPTMFLCGNNEKSKGEVKKILAEFGWKDVIDLGDITAARGMEMMLPIWVRLLMTTNDAYFGFKIIKKSS